MTNVTDENGPTPTGGIVLAEYDGQVWLVAGEEHMDALLSNTLPAEVPSTLVRCADRAAVFALWHERGENQDGAAQPWALNPLISRNVLGRLGLAARVVRFTPWSAAMDEAAASTIAGAAAWIAENPAGRLVLRQFLPEPAPPGIADLQRLRAQLVRAALVRALAEGGTDPAPAMADETEAAAAAADTDRMVLVTVPPPS